MAAELARYSGDEKARRAYLDRGLAAAPEDAGVLAAFGELSLDKKEWTKAEGYFRRARAADSRNADAALGLGKALYRQAKYADSEAAYGEAVALEPKLPFAYADRARARYQLGKYEEAMADLDAAAARAPDSSWIYLDRGRMNLDLERRDRAEADLTRSISLDPEYFLPYVYRAGMYEEAGRDVEALSDYRRIIQLQPDYWYALESAGAVAFRLGLWEESAARFKEAFGFAPERYEYAILSSVSLLRAGKAAEARALAGKVAPGVDREKNGIYWLMLRLLQDQNDQSSELEIRIQSEKRLDVKAGLLFYLGEYWIGRGKPEIGMKYLVLAKEMRREDCLEYRLLGAELKRLAGANG